MGGSGSIPKLALCLGTTTDYLFGLTDDPNPPQAAQPEGQMMICGWMPGGTNPGPEPGWCVAMMALDSLMKFPKSLWWDGYVWKFSQDGTYINAKPVAWMRLPEYEGGDQDD